MATLTLRSTKGAPLTFAELDSNFTDLNSEAVKNLTYVAPNLVITQGDDTSLSVNIRDIVTYSSLNANGDVGTGSTQVARGNHVHEGLHFSGTQELTMLDGRLSLGNGTVLSYGQNRNITQVGAGTEDFYIYLGRASTGTHSIKYYYQGHSSYNSIQLDFALDYDGTGTDGVSLHAGLNTVKLFKSKGANEVSSIHIVKRDISSAEVYIKHTLNIPAGTTITVNWSVQSQGNSTDAFYFPTDPLYTLNAGNTVTNFVQEVTRSGHTNFLSVGGDGNALTNLNWNAISGIPLTTTSIDNTANRITKVGDFGVGAAVTPIENTDLNSIPVSGFYGLNTSAVANKPTGMSGASTLLQINYDSNDKMQMVFNRNNSNQWIRNQVSGTWTSWIEILTDQNTGTVVTSDITTSATDTTAGRVTKVGDFGLGADANNAPVEAVNLNSLTYSGFYCHSATAANRPPNSTGSNGSVFVVAGGANSRATQYATNASLNDNRAYVRMYNGSVWTPWIEILTESSIINAATLDNIDSTQFLRSDVNDVVTSNITFNDNKFLRFGTGNDVEFFCNGSNMYTNLNSGINNWHIRDGNITRFTFDDDGTFTATNKIKVNELEVDTPKTYNDASTQIITRQGVSTYISRWTGGGATYTLDEATFITGDKVYVTRMWDRVGTLTITSGQVIYLPDTSAALSQTLAVLGTVCFEYIGYAWMARAA